MSVLKTIPGGGLFVWETCNGRISTSSNPKDGQFWRIWSDLSRSQVPRLVTGQWDSLPSLRCLSPAYVACCFLFSSRYSVGQVSSKEDLTQFDLLHHSWHLLNFQTLSLLIYCNLHVCRIYCHYYYLQDIVYAELSLQNFCTSLYLDLSLKKQQVIIHEDYVKSYSFWNYPCLPLAQFSMRVFWKIFFNVDIEGFGKRRWKSTKRISVTKTQTWFLQLDFQIYPLALTSSIWPQLQRAINKNWNIKRKISCE